MIYDDIITVEYNPLSRRMKHRYIIKYWKNGKVRKKFCWWDALGVTDTVLGKWGQEYTSKYIWYTLSAVMATIWEDCRNSWGYYDLLKTKDVEDKDSRVQHQAAFEIKKYVYNSAHSYINNACKGFNYHGRLYDTASFFYIHQRLMKAYVDILDLQNSYKTLDEFYDKDYMNWCKKEMMFGLITWFHRIKINDIDNFLLFGEIDETQWTYGEKKKESPICQEITKWDKVE
jgi:hypothetical protein